MTVGTINVFIPRTADGERLTGPYKARTVKYPRSVDVRTFHDPLADRNLSNAIPAPRPKPFDPRFAPNGWTLRPTVAAPVAPVVAEVEVPAEHCGKNFRTPGGYSWHITNMHKAVAA